MKYLLLNIRSDRPYFGVLPGQFRPFLPFALSLFFAGVSFPAKKHISEADSSVLAIQYRENATKRLPRAHDVSVHPFVGFQELRLLICSLTS
jgi:hypothetical protein